MWIRGKLRNCVYYIEVITVVAGVVTHNKYTEFRA